MRIQSVKETRDGYSALAFELTDGSLAEAAESLASVMNVQTPENALLVRQHFLDMVESRLKGDVWALASYVH